MCTRIELTEEELDMVIGGSYTVQPVRITSKKVCKVCGKYYKEEDGHVCGG